MIARNLEGQVFVVLGEGDIGIASVLMGDAKIKSLCFKQLEAKYKVGEPLNEKEFDPNTINTFLCFRSDDDILLMIRKLAILAMKDAGAGEEVKYKTRYWKSSKILVPVVKENKSVKGGKVEKKPVAKKKRGKQ